MWKRAAFGRGRASASVRGVVWMMAAAGLLGCSGDDAESAAPDSGVVGAGVIDFGALPPFATGGRGGASGSGASGSGASGSSGTADAGTSTRADAAASATPFDAGGVAINAGVLTNQPQLGFVDTGTQDLVITSAFIRLQQAGDSSTVLLHGEIQNQGMATRCILTFDVAVIGVLDVLVVIDAPPYFDPSGFSSLSYGCLAPGERGAFKGIENDVSPTLIEDSTEVRYAITGLERDFVPHPSAPVLLSADRMLDESTHTYRVVGQLRGAPTNIYNLGISFYGKNALGLVVDDTDAYPNDLDTIAARATLDYQSFPFTFATESADAVIHFAEFIVGTAPASSSQTRYETQPASTDLLRLQRVRALRRELAARKERLHD